MAPKPILIVDDSDKILTTVSTALEKLTLPVETTAYAEDALFRLSKGSEYSLVLLDLELWGMGGMEMLRRVSERWPSLRVAIMTAYGSEEDEAEAQRLGVVDFIRKPFTPKDLRARVTKMLREFETEGREP